MDKLTRSSLIRKGSFSNRSIPENPAKGYMMSSGLFVGLRGRQASKPNRVILWPLASQRFSGLRVSNRSDNAASVPVVSRGGQKLG